MAHIVLTNDDERRVDALMAKFEPTTYQPIARFADLMPSADWHFAIGYMRRHLRAEIVGCILVRAYAEELLRRGMVHTSTLEDLFHGELDFTQLDFGYMRLPGANDEETRWVDLMEKHPEQILNERTGRPDRSVLGETFSRVRQAIEVRLLGDIDPRTAASA